MTDILPKLADPKSVLVGSSPTAADHSEGMSYLERLPKRLITLYLPLFIILAVLLFPFYWMTLTAIKPDEQLLDLDRFSPFWTWNPTFKHIYKLLFETYYPLWLWNTMLVAVSATVLSIVASVLAAYAHFFGVLVLPAQWASLPFMRFHGSARRQLLVTTLIILVLLAPLGIFILTRDSGQLDWVPTTTLQDIIGLLYLLAGALFWSELLLALYLASVSIALIEFAARWRRKPTEAGSYGLLLTSVLVPIMVTLAVSHFKPIFVDRYLLICLPYFVLLAAAGLCRLRPKWLLAGTLVALVTFALRTDGLYYQYFHKEDWRGATQYVLSRAQAGDALIFYADEARFPFDYYRQRPGGDYPYPVVVSPRWDSCFRVGNTYVGGRDVIGPNRFLLNNLTSRYRRVWLVLNHDRIRQLGRDRESRFVRTSLAGEYPSVIERKFFGVDVLLYSTATRANGRQLTRRLLQHHAVPVMVPASRKATKVVHHVGAT